MATTKEISMQFHPRAFAALGADLVTNDTVAVTELVKNCYDAFAYNVSVDFGEDSKGKYIQISDDGFGMTIETIETSWAVIATPYKQKNPIVSRNSKIRRVSGNKGLGRLSAARLGNTMLMWTKNSNEPCHRVKINWNSFAQSSNIGDCRISIEDILEQDYLPDSGTIIRIRELSTDWDKEKIDELRNNLSRMISPFTAVDMFNITLSSLFYESPIKITPTPLIENPVYKIHGKVNDAGVIYWNYSFCPIGLISASKPRKRKGSIAWDEAKAGFKTHLNVLSTKDNLSAYKAGQFSFEIRVWDLDSDSIDTLTKTFDLKRRSIREVLNQYKGLSIYRDNILVLPKSDASKDWLGIDLRRISSIGKRISTSQIVGIINISSAKNPEIKDTTDREKLVDTEEYKQLVAAIGTIIVQLENLRFEDRAKEQPKQNIRNLMLPLSAQSLVDKIDQAVQNGEKYQDILEYVREYSYENEKGLGALQERLTYYAQTASLGSVAIVILHEMLTGMTVIKRFLRHSFGKFSPFDHKTQEYYDDAEASHSRIMEVTNSFAPLYRRDLRKSSSKCNLKDALDKSIRLTKSQKNSRGVEFVNHIANQFTAKVVEAELQTVFVNLLDNACYWIQKNDKDKRIEISCNIMDDTKRLEIMVSDTGTGILNENAQLIFEPGVTAKPHGIGMGLVIVTEIVNFYGGRISTVVPGVFGGATFEFDIPIE